MFNKVTAVSLTALKNNADTTNTAIAITANVLTIRLICAIFLVQIKFSGGSLCKKQINQIYNGMI